MKPYNTLFEKKKSLQEQISFLDIYKVGGDDVMKLVQDFISKFNAPRAEIYKELSKLFATLATEADEQMKERNKMKK